MKFKTFAITKLKKVENKLNVSKLSLNRGKLNFSVFRKKGKNHSQGLEINTVCKQINRKHFTLAFSHFYG